MIDATVAIITFKRPAWLTRCINSLIKQEFDIGVAIDILIVDNACDETTKEIVANIAKNSPIKIKYAKEKTRGIVAARNKCVEIFHNSQSKNLIFIDDDEWPKYNNWVQMLLDKKNEYSADIVTSHVISVGESGVPGWAVQLIYGNNKLKEGELVKKFYTNNLLISRNVLELVNPAFDYHFALTGASDYHFSLKCYKAGFRAVYVDAPVEEEFPASRAKITWFIKRGFRSGVGFTRSHMLEEVLPIAILRGLCMSLVRLLRGGTYLTLGCIMFSKLKFVDGVFRISSAVGTLAGFIGIKCNEYRQIHGR